MKTIELTRGQVALVSDEDYERVNTYRWQARYSKRSNQFVAIGYIDGTRNVMMHRFVMEVFDPKIYVDHKFHNTLDNQREHLRICTAAQNSANIAKKRTAATSRFKGVSWDSRPRRIKRWASSIKRNGKNYKLGFFETQEAAAYAWNKKAIEIHGEFACLNQLTEQEMAIALCHPSKKEKTSDYPGVSWRERSKRWEVYATINEKRCYLGSHKDEKEAAMIYQKTTQTTGNSE